MFRYVDRVRLVYSTMTEAIDIAELQTAGIMVMDYPVHNMEKREAF